MASAYSDLELRYARPLAAGLIADAEFRQWAFANTSYDALAYAARHDADLQRRRRNRPTMKNPYWFNYWCGKDRNCTCRIGTAVETDILLIFDCGTGENLAVHVEVKRPGDHLGDGQAVTYRRRAACWAREETRPKRIPEHGLFLTILACGEELAEDTDLAHFDRVLFHKDIAERLTGYPEP